MTISVYVVLKHRSAHSPFPLKGASAWGQTVTESGTGVLAITDEGHGGGGRESAPAARNAVPYAVHVAREVQR